MEWIHCSVVCKSKKHRWICDSNMEILFGTKLLCVSVRTCSSGTPWPKMMKLWMHNLHLTRGRFLRIKGREIEKIWRFFFAIFFFEPKASKPPEASHSRRRRCQCQDRKSATKNWLKITSHCGSHDENQKWSNGLPYIRRDGGIGMFHLFWSRNPSFDLSYHRHNLLQSRSAWELDCFRSWG